VLGQLENWPALVVVGRGRCEVSGGIGERGEDEKEEEERHYFGKVVQPSCYLPYHHEIKRVLFYDFLRHFYQ